MTPTTSEALAKELDIKPEQDKLTEEQHVKIMNMGWPDDIPDSDDGKKKDEGAKPTEEESEENFLEKEEIKEGSATETEEGEADEETPEALRQKADALEKERVEKDRIEKEAQARIAKEESEKKEKERLEKLSKETGKTVQVIQEEERIVAEKAENERLSKIATEQKITVDEVKRNEAEEKKIVEDYGQDPVKLAQALRQKLSENTKISSELETVKKQTQQEDDLVSQEVLEAKLILQREKIIEEARKQYEDELADKDDDEVYEFGKKLLKKEYENLKSETEKKHSTLAETKRKELIEKVSDEYKEYLPAIQETLNKCSNAQVLQPTFSLNHICLWARGKKYTPEYVKELETKAFKRGQEEVKIMGVISKTPSAARSGVKRGVASNLNESEKKRALVRYSSNTKLSNEEKYALYEKEKDNDF